jgi:hypothetical protein
MMRKVALVLALSFVVGGGALAANPSLSAGGGGMNVLDTGRNVAWSEPPNLDGLIASSEVIGDFGLESEIANDFVLGQNDLVTLARWWGGYYNGNGCGDTGYGTNWNLRFYDDGGCVPNNVIYETVGASANETSIGCQAGLYPLFSYEVDCVNVPVLANTLYWFGAQCGNHVFPPQVGRLASAQVVNCESVFKAPFFAFPDWVAAIDVFGVSVDFSQEFEVFTCITPTVKTTWGAVKGLYR